MSRGVLIAALVAVGVLFALPSIGSASPSGNSPEPERIIFSNGGRIVQVNADGTGRKVLTRQGRVTVPATRSQVQDRHPRVSPDGTRVLFTRFSRPMFSTPGSRFLRGGKNMLLILDSGKVREVLPQTGKARYSNLAWLPGTDRVVASKLSGRVVTRASVVSLKLDGSGEETILRFRGRPDGFPSGSSRFEAARLAPSPDGTRLLMTRAEPWTGSDVVLELVDLQDGKRSLVEKNARSGAWSPDGSRIAFVRDREVKKVCDADVYCYPRGRIVVAAADGSGASELTDSRGDEDGPTWSADGNRIAFSGTIVRPRDRATAEIFTIDADGSCLTAVTNGSPASFEPTFALGAEPEPKGASCGLGHRSALAEGHLNKRMNKGLGPRLWLGPQSSQGLLSFDADFGQFSYSLYDDCAVLETSECPPGVAVTTLPLCGLHDVAEIVGGLVKSGTKRRGVWVSTFTSGSRIWLEVFSGAQLTYVGPTGSGKNAPRPLTRSELHAVVDKLRPEGGKLTRRLPRLLLPRFDFKVAQNMVRFVRRNSIREAMVAFNIEREDVINQLRFRQNAKKLGAGVASCPSVIKA